MSEKLKSIEVALRKSLSVTLKEMKKIEESEEYKKGWHDACNDLTYLTGKRDSLFENLSEIRKRNE